MKLNVLAIVLAASAIGGFSASAQTVIEERRDPAVVIEHDKPDTSVTVEKRDGLLGTEKKTIKKSGKKYPLIVAPKKCSGTWKAEAQFFFRTGQTLKTPFSGKCTK